MVMNQDNLALTPAGLRRYNRWHLILALVLLLLLFLLPLLFGIGPGSWRQCAGTAVTAAPVAAAPAMAPAATEPAPAPSEPTAAPAVVAGPPDTVKLFFDVGSAEVPVNVREQLAAVIGYLKVNPSAMAVISGFHDATGNRASNEQLAHNRARAVRALLGSEGIEKERVDMAKPQETTGSGTDAEARRVEVSVR
jgi:K(+)-stimulated pyrophosphate-energized sodium pump